MEGGDGEGGEVHSRIAWSGVTGVALLQGNSCSLAAHLSERMTQMIITRKQRLMLERLYPYPSFLYPEVIERFFRWSDAGEVYSERGLPPGGGYQLKALADSHKFSWHSSWFEQSLSDDFRTGIMFLGDFDGSCTKADDHSRQQALRVYAESLGQTTHWYQAKDWWEKGWLKGRPIAWG